jgi:hypothetical protein
MLTIGSASTSIRHVPAGFKKLVEIGSKINLDWGGGKYDDGTKYLNSWGIINLIYDPYNRSKDHNKEMLNFCTAIGGADSGTLLNVLCVIPDQDERLAAVEKLFIYLKPSAKVILGVWPGNKSMKLKLTSKGWQMNQPLCFYQKEILEAFSWMQAEYVDKFLILHK